MGVPPQLDGLWWVIIENPILKWMMTGSTPILGNPESSSISRRNFHEINHPLWASCWGTPIELNGIVPYKPSIGGTSMTMETRNFGISGWFCPLKCACEMRSLEPTDGWILSHCWCLFDYAKYDLFFFQAYLKQFPKKQSWSGWKSFFSGFEDVDVWYPFLEGLFFDET